MKLGTQIHIGTLQGVLNPIFNYNTVLANKPTRAIWTSTWKNGTSAWVKWCEESRFQLPNVWRGILLEPDKDAVIYTIDSKSDLEYLNKLCERSSRLIADFDFNILARHFDAIHLTEEGRWETEFYGLNGWDCESTCWLQPAYTVLEEVQFPVNKTHFV